MNVELLNISDAGAGRLVPESPLFTHADWVSNRRAHNTTIRIGLMACCDELDEVLSVLLVSCHTFAL